MKKKIIAVASAFCLSVASLGMVDLRVSAQENEKGQEDFSYLLTGDVIIGQMQPETKGEILFYSMQSQCFQWYLHRVNFTGYTGSAT